MSRRGILLAVDLSYQVYRAAASHSNLTSADGLFTGGLYGFLVSLAKAIRVTNATRAVVCLDLKPYKRSLLYPEYKQLRQKSSDPELKAKFDTSRAQVLAALVVIGIPLLGVPGYESDDIIAHLVRQHRHRFEAIYAASNDSDLFQLFTCPWFRMYHKDDAVMDGAKLFQATGLTPEQHSLATALMGTHNDVAGIPGVGEKTAIKAVKDPGLLRTYRERHNNLIERNLRLVRLPYDGFPRDVNVPAMGSFKHRLLYKFCDQFDIAVTGYMLDAFEKVCP